MQIVNFSHVMWFQVLQCTSVDESYSNDRDCAVLFVDALHFAVQGGSNF